MTAKQIINNIVEQGYNFGGYTKSEFVEALCGFYGCSKQTANRVAKMSGAW